MGDNKKNEILDGISEKVSNRLVAAAKELVQEEIKQMDDMLLNVGSDNVIGYAKLVETKAKIKAMAFREVSNLQKESA
jgi:translation initiation factor 2 gamma subunit (eIF-2gamma)